MFCVRQVKNDVRVFSVISKLLAEKKVDESFHRLGSSTFNLRTMEQMDFMCYTEAKEEKYNFLHVLGAVCLLLLHSCLIHPVSLQPLTYPPIPPPQSSVMLPLMTAWRRGMPGKKSHFLKSLHVHMEELDIRNCSAALRLHCISQKIFPATSVNLLITILKKI